VKLNNKEADSVFTQVWSLRIFRDFDEIQYRVLTTD